jgi:hypothetical protein
VDYLATLGYATFTATPLRMPCIPEPEAHTKARASRVRKQSATDRLGVAARASEPQQPQPSQQQCISGWRWDHHRRDVAREVIH